MALPTALQGRLRLPAIASPLFLVSGPDLVVETCRAGVLGTVPALNQRSTAGLADWLDEIEGRLQTVPAAAPFGVNLIAHRSNPRLDADLRVVVDHKVPVVITSLGAVPDLVQAVHAYGGVVFHDVISVRHAWKAVEANVDGIVAVCAGAGGHAGTISPFALVAEIRRFFPGAIALAGAISTGAHIAAARVMGADLAYLGTRFIATQESLAAPEYKAMLVGAKAADVVYTASVSGVNANFMRQSLIAAGMDPAAPAALGAMNLEHEAKAWRDIWSAGHGVGAIEHVPTTAALCAMLLQEYQAAAAAFTA